MRTDPGETHSTPWNIPVFFRSAFFDGAYGASGYGQEKPPAGKNGILRFRASAGLSGLPGTKDRQNRRNARSSQGSGPDRYGKPGDRSEAPGLRR